jgi:hypothetical protein
MVSRPVNTVSNTTAFSENASLAFVSVVNISSSGVHAHKALSMKINDPIFPMLTLKLVFIDVSQNYEIAG